MFGNRYSRRFSPYFGAEAPQGPSPPRLVREYFCYNADFIPLALSAVAATVTIPIQADANFIDVKHTFTDFEAADNTAVRIFSLGGTAAPNVLVTLISTGPNRQLSDSATHLLNWYGFAWLPFLLPHPIELQANAALQVQLTNRVATAVAIRLSHHGYKEYVYESQER